MHCKSLWIKASAKCINLTHSCTSHHLQSLEHFIFSMIWHFRCCRRLFLHNTCTISNDLVVQVRLALNIGGYMQMLGAYILVIPTVTSQSVLCSDIFQWSFALLHASLHKEGTMLFEAHGMPFPCIELLLFNYAKANTVFHSMTPWQTINYDFCCFLIVSKVVVKFRYWIGLGIENMVMQNMCFINSLLINSRYVNNRHASNYIILWTGNICTHTLESLLLDFQSCARTFLFVKGIKSQSTILKYEFASPPQGNLVPFKNGLGLLGKTAACAALFLGF